MGDLFCEPIIFKHFFKETHSRIFKHYISFKNKSFNRTIKDFLYYKHY